MGSHAQYAIHISAGDLIGLVQFCVAAFEWTFVPSEERVIELSTGGLVAAVATPTSGDLAPGAVPVFFVENVVDSCLVAERHRGRVVEKFDSTFALLAGATGEMFGVIEVARADPERVGRDTWLEIWSPDPDRAMAFYGHVLGWTYERSDATRSLAFADAAPIADVFELDETFDDIAFRRALGQTAEVEQRTGPHFMAYSRVRNLREAVARARFLGGRVALAPTRLSTRGWGAIVKEPQGGYLGLLES